LKFKKIELKNFGPYKGDAEIEFKGDDENGLWIIWGSNGAGKTHVFKAIKWCLYGWDPRPEDKLRTPTTKDAWGLIYGTNLAEAIPVDPYMHVYIWLEANAPEGNHQYLIKRLVRPITTNPRNHTQIEVKLEVIVDGVPSTSARETIESILPVAASQFFMFHGEELREISQKHIEQTQKAIELILEAETFRRGRADLDYVAKQIDAELDTQRARSSALTGLLQDKKETLELVEQLQSSKEKDRAELEGCVTELKEVEEKLSSSEGAQKLMGELDQLRRRHDDMSEQLDNLREGRTEYIDDLAPKLVLPRLRRILKTKEERQLRLEQVKSQISELNGRKSLADRVGQLNMCICGRPLAATERGHIEEEKKRIDQQIKDLESSLEPDDPSYFEVKDTIKEIQSSKLDFVKYEKGYRELELRIDEISGQIEGKEKDLENSAVDKIRELGSRRLHLIDKKGRLDERLSRLRRDIEEENNHLGDIAIKIKSIEGYDAIRDKLEKQVKLAQNCVKAFDYVLERLSETKRDEIERYSTELFRKLTNKPEEYDRIHIDSSYDVYVIDKQGVAVERTTLSTGERGVVALSFILGLMKASGKNAPLVLDTFFVHLDEAHYTNIVNAMPDFAEQTILILTNLEYKNLKERASSSFFEHVKGTWQVTRDQSARVSSIKPIQETVVQQ